MRSISIKQIKEDEYEVTVRENTTTQHTVTVSDSYYKKLTDGEISKEELLEKSFAFLLARESNTMILSQFDLPVIQRYFSDYEGQMRC